MPAPISLGNYINPPAYIHSSINNTRFNRILAESFLTGIYNLLYVISIYRLLRRGNSIFHIIMLTSLWALISVCYAIRWEIVRIAFVNHNNSPFEVAQENLGFASDIAALSVVSEILMVSALVIADTLLAWRCFVVWQKNKWVLYSLSLLLTGNLVIGIFTGLPTSTFPGSKSHPLSTGLLRNTLFGIFFIVCLVNTVVATALILLKIWITSRRIRSPFSYKRLGAILVESGVLYSAALLGQTVLAAINWAYPVNTFQYQAKLNVATEVIACLVMPVTGIAPTLIALRIGREVIRTDASDPVSHITFKRTRHSVTQLSITTAIPLPSLDPRSTQASAEEYQEIRSSETPYNESV